MYESYFNLTGKPFDLLPNPDFLFLSKSHKKALTYLDFALQERAGFILLTGDIGSGKTTLIRDLIRKHHEKIVLAKVFNTMVGAEQLLALINDDFGITGKSREKSTLLRDLNEFLIEQYGRGNRPVLIIDEAQNLSAETLEEVRMLSNLETDEAKLLQIILVGQPELKQTLSLPRLKQLRQRISVVCHLQPLTQEEVELYILHRLEVAGNRDAIAFSQPVINMIWRYSRGIPRLVNIICDFLLLTAFAEEKKEISVELATEVIGELDFEYQFWGDCKPTDNADEKTCNPSPVPLQEKGNRQDEIKDLLTEIIHRIDLLEKRDPTPDLKSLTQIDNRLEKSELVLREYMRVSSKEIVELKKDVQGLKAVESPTATAAEPEGDEGKRKGFLGKLFRAA